MFGKKKEKKFNPYENHTDEMLYKVWEERDRLYEKTRQAITRVGVINLYPDCPDRKKAVSDAEEAKHALIVAIGAYDTARMEYNNYIKKYAESSIVPKRNGLPQAMKSLNGLTNTIIKGERNENYC